MKEYLIWSNEHRAWWGPRKLGYTLDRNHAGIYSRDEAIAICRDARRGQRTTWTVPPEIPVLAADMEAMYSQ